MDDTNKSAAMRCNAGFLGISDGKMDKVGSLTKKTSWMPASAGMTMGVGGASH